MTSLTDSWAQDVAVDIRIPAISPPVVRHLLPVIEMQIRKIIQQAHKFQKRGKSRCLTGTYRGFILFHIVFTFSSNIADTPFLHHSMRAYLLINDVYAVKTNPAYTDN